MSAEHEPSDAMISQAAHWLAVLQGEDVSHADRKAFHSWRHADPRHHLAVARMEALMGAFDDLPSVPSRKALSRTFTPAPASFFRPGFQAIALVGVLACGWFGVEQAPVWLADQRTHIGERREISLSDGSQLRLNSDSALDVEFDERQRLIDLRKGEIWVEVAKDQHRPFVVRTDQGTITALGTRFVVRKAADGAVQVSVLESAIAAKAQRSGDVKVATGEQATLKDGLVQTPQVFGNQDPAAWTRGVLKVDDQPLSDVLQALAVYRHGVLQFDEQALAGLRVSGLFRLDDTDAALATLADNLPIKVEHYTDLFVMITPKQ
jgi:transmembrane sensor